MRADDLRYLLAVARTHNRALAAADLGVDASTVTRRIRALEYALGVRLVQQGHAGWELTDIGRTVAGTAAPIEEAVERAVGSVSSGAGRTLRGNVRITAPDAFGAYFAAPALVRLRERHPELTVELLTATRELNLHQSAFDLAITVGAPSSARLLADPLTDYTLGLFASREYLTAHGNPRRLDELRAHPFIWYVDSLLQVGELDLDKHLPGVTPTVMSTSVFAQTEATRARGGIGLLPCFVAERHPDLVRVLATQVDVRLDFTLVTRRDRLGNPAVQAIADVLHREVGRRRPELRP